MILAAAVVCEDMGLTQSAKQSIIFINDNNSQLKNAYVWAERGNQ